MIESLLGKGLPTNLGQLIAKARTTENAAPANGLNKTQSQLVDQVDISDETKQSLETLKNLDKQLTRFLDVLKGKRSAGGVLRQLQQEGLSLSGTQTRSALNLTQIKSIQETTALTAEINDNGELDLVLTQVKDSLSSSNLSLSTQKSSFFAKF